MNSTCKCNTQLIVNADVGRLDRFDQGFTQTRIVPTAAARVGNLNLGGALGTINANTNSIYGFTVNPRITQFLNQF